MNYQKEIQRLEKKLAIARAGLAKEQGRVWLQLAKDNGFNTIDLLIKALLPYASPVMRGKLGSGVKVSAAVVTKAPATAPKRRKRAKIDVKKRDAIIADLKTGKMTGWQVAKKHGISVPSVSNIKKAAGLVKAKKPEKK